MICTVFEKRTRVTHDHSSHWIKQNEPKTDLDLNHNLLEQVQEGPARSQKSMRFRKS